MRSLRVRLILLLGVAIMAAAALQIASSFQAAMRQANRLFDYHMQQMALALQDSPFEQVEWENLRGSDDSGFEFVIQVWSDSGVRVYQSRSYRLLPEKAVLGYSTVTLENGDWRIYAVRTPKRVIQIAQQLKTRRDRALSLVWRSLWPVIPVFLLLFVAAWWVVSSALSPLNRIGHELANRNANSLAPISDAGVPREVSLLVTELNSLLVRMGQALQSQQHFVADAAHELRSPLTALRLQVQTLERAKDETARAQAIGRLLGGVDRGKRLVEQLLVLARQDPLAQAFEPGVLSLPACIEQAAGDITGFALSRQVEVRCADLPPAEIMGDAESLRIMLRNLLDNAVRYSPEQGLVRIALAVDGARATLTIEDSGSGIPAEGRSRVFDRFYRVPGTNPSGSGLGLSIVRAIADKHQAALELGDAALGGLKVQVIFPLRAAASPPSHAGGSAPGIPRNPA